MKKCIYFILVLCLIGTSCKTIELQDYYVENEKTIILFGEEHGIDWILKKAFDMWNTLYVDEGLRHLFNELPYFDAEFINLWMKSDNDDIFNVLFQEKRGTAFYNINIYNFYMQIKSECPQTIFHGTDVGHQYSTSGKHFLDILF